MAFGAIHPGYMALLHGMFGTTPVFYYVAPATLASPPTIAFYTDVYRLKNGGPTVGTTPRTDLGPNTYQWSPDPTLQPGHYFLVVSLTINTSDREHELELMPEAGTD